MTKTKLYTGLMASLIAALMLALPIISAAADKEEKEEDRIRNAGMVMKEILDIPDDIPQNLLDKAHCAIVFPSVVKAAFIVGGSYGRGVMVCRSGRNHEGPWGAPVMMALEAGSFGFQIGAEGTDFVILVMNEHGAQSLLHNKVKLGADASIAAGPKGRDSQADTDAAMRAEMLSYSRARGLFAGISLEGASLRPDHDANRRLYGREVTPDEIADGKVQPPEAAHGLISRLERSSPRTDSH